MRTRFLAALVPLSLAVVFGVASVVPAGAATDSPQESPKQSPKDSPKSAAPKAAPLKAPNLLPKIPRVDRLNNLDFLFGALKAAPDEDTAKAIEQRIWGLWVVSRSDTANLLMLRVKTAVEAKDTNLAIKLLDGIVKIRPDYIEAWNRRATIYYQKKEYGRSLADIREVLKREPRHFGALSGLGMILQDLGDDKQALEVYRRALAVYPHLQRIPDMVKKLREKVEGRDI
jgi:tetratricopeptide (TPR) repeat protein